MKNQILFYLIILSFLMVNFKCDVSAIVMTFEEAYERSTVQRRHKDLDDIEILKAGNESWLGLDTSRKE